MLQKALFWLANICWCLKHAESSIKDIFILDWNMDIIQ